MRNLAKLLSPTALLYMYVVVTQVAHGIYLASTIEPPAVFALIDFVGLLWIMGWWLLTDSRKRGVAWVYDIGFFLSIAWVIVMPYYLLRTRGKKGVLLIVGFFTIYIGSIL